MFHKLTTKLGNMVTNSRRDAVLLTSLFAVIPLLNWLALSMACLITLRKGTKEGLLIFAVPCSYQLIKLTTVMPLHIALVSVLVSNVGLFIAAILLRHFINWSITLAGLFAYFMVLITVVLWIYPDYATLQLDALKQIVTQLQDVNIMQDDIGITHSIALIAKFMLGIQVSVFMLAALFSLYVGRAIQSELFNPGGLQKELKLIEGHWLMVLLCLISLFGIQRDWTLALNALPLLCCYFSVVGLSVSYCYASSMFKMSKRWLLLIVIAVIILPMLLIPLIPIGFIDSIFKFRKKQSLNLRLNDRS